MKALALGILVLVVSGCATSGPDINPGIIYSGVEGPIMATASEAATKSGQACASNVLGLVAFGNNSIEAAKKNGGIKTVSSADYNMFTILGVYSEKCTIVRGSN